MQHEVIELPWPPKELSPNARMHWARKGRIAKKYRDDCYFLTIASGAKASADEFILDIEFIPPDRRKRDDDNCLASFKAGRDGIADALGIDDNRFRTLLTVSREPVKGGKVVVKIRAQESIAESA